MLFKNFYKSPIGEIVLLSDESNLLGLWFKDQINFGGSYKLSDAKVYASTPIKIATKWLNLYFDGQNPNPFNVPVKLNETPFRNNVLNKLKRVSYGHTVTYKQLSDKMQENIPHKVNKARATGNAVGHNPILLIIPCHRVIGNDGKLTGYAAGIQRKSFLLELEKNTIHNGPNSL